MCRFAIFVLSFVFSKILFHFPDKKSRGPWAVEEFRRGPSSVESVRRGEVGFAYDTPYVIITKHNQPVLGTAI
jgi:hypothetical protein